MTHRAEREHTVHYRNSARGGSSDLPDLALTQSSASTRVIGFVAETDAGHRSDTSVYLFTRNPNKWRTDGLLPSRAGPGRYRMKTGWFSTREMPYKELYFVVRTAHE